MSLSEHGEGDGLVEILHRHADGLTHAHEGNEPYEHNCGHNGTHWVIERGIGTPCGHCAAHGRCPDDGELIPRRLGDIRHHEHMMPGATKSSGPVVWSERDE